MNKNLLKKLYYAGLSVLQADKFRTRRLKQQNKIVVLNLHRISPEEDPFWSPLKPKIFEELLRFLSDNFEVCLFNQLKSVNSAKPLAVLSFDDGYYDFIEYALPLLEKYKMRANMNVIPQCVESGKPIWNVRLYNFLNSAPRSLVDNLKLPDFNRRLTGDDAESKSRYGLQISSYMKNRPRKERDELLQIIEPLLAELEFKETRMMSVREVRQISTQTEIGVHSFSHESMGYETDEFFAEDFADCKNYFENKLKLPLEIYAFPNGSHSQRQIEILRTQRIKHILLVDEKFADFPADVYPRLTVYGKTKQEVKLKSLGF